jgi:tRNA dimethylallyltransferase
LSAPFPAACLYLSGPTAAGKTAVGVELARLVGGEIVALDSMTLYRGMDVGTAKPTAAERAAVPHHLVDELDPHEECSQAEYATLARRAVDDILSRGKVPLFVGGTPLYLKTLLRGMFEGPAADWDFRHRVEAEARAHGGDWLQQRVAEVDPATAAKLHANDERRLIRALEVFQLTGTPISVHQQQFEAVRTEAVGRVFVLDWPRDELYQRIDRRVDAMIADGLIDEVRRLAAAPQSLGRTARQALGYREVLEHLAAGPDLATTIEAIKTHTRQFAKRQLTWFRSLAECRTIPLSGNVDPRDVAEQIFAQLQHETNDTNA